MAVLTTIDLTSGAAASATSSPARDTTGAKSIFIVQGKLGSRLVSFSDSEGNSYVPLTDYGNDFEAEVQILYCRNPITSTTHTWTMGHGFDPAAYASAVVLVMDDDLVVSPVDAQNGARAGSGATLAAGSVTPSQTGCLVIAAMSMQPVGSTLTIDSGYNLAIQNAAQSGNSYGSAVAWKIHGTTATNPTWTCSSSAGTLAASIAVFKLAGGGDTTAPVLSSPTGTATGPTTATVGATTDEGNGTLYGVVTTSATQPSVAQIKAGQDHTGAAAVWGGSGAVSATGARTLSATGLAASTSYRAHLVHSDAAGNDSNRVTAAAFTTPAIPYFDLTLANRDFSTNNGTPIPSEALTFWAYNPSTGALVATITGLSTNASAIVTAPVAHASLAASTTYRLVWKFASGKIGVAELATEA